jgi:hypothetical protein
MPSESLTFGIDGRAEQLGSDLLAAFPARHQSRRKGDVVSNEEMSLLAIYFALTGSASLAAVVRQSSLCSGGTLGSR